jgi:hypothetical protein
LFPELAGPLQDAFDRAEPGQAHVLPELQKISSAALRKPMFAAIRRAGLKPWPRLFHNLRSSRQTDLEQQFPGHVVCKWLGNSQATAMRHYLQVLDSDYEKAAQIPAQQAPETPCNGGNGGGPESAKTTVSAGVSHVLQAAAIGPDDPDGICTPHDSPGKTGVGAQSGAESGARPARIDPADPDLAELAAAWPRLDPATRARLLDQARAALAGNPGGVAGPGGDPARKG